MVSNVRDILPSPQPPDLSWISKLPVLESGKQGATENYRPSFIIGLGETGRVVLNLIKKTLYDQCLAEYPSNVRFLLLEQERRSPDADLLARDERLDCTQSDQPVDYVGLSTRPYFAWMRASAVQPTDRARARMNFMLSLQSRERSLLYSALRRGLFHFQTLPHIFLIGNLVEPDSAVLWDLAFLLRNKVMEGSGMRLNSACITAILSFDCRKSAEFDPKNDRFAPLRELNRFLLGNLSVFTYPLPDLSGVSEGRLLDSCFLIDMECPNRPDLDLNTIPLTEGVGRIMSEAICVLLHSDCNKIVQDLVASNRRLMEAQEKVRQAFIGSIGVSTIGLPFRELQDALESKMVRTLLFGNGDLSPEDGFLSVPYGSSQPRILRMEDSREAIVRFFREQAVNYHPVFSAIVDVVNRKGNFISISSLPSGLDRLFFAKLTAWITLELNGMAPTFQDRSGGILRAWTKVQALKQFLIEAQEAIGHQKAIPLTLKRMLDDHLNNWVDIVQKTDDEFGAWIDALSRKDHRGQRGRVGRTGSEDGLSLLELIERDWMEAREVLRERVKAPILRAPLTPGENIPPYTGLEYPFFETYILPLIEETGARNYEAMDHFASRVGWLGRITDHGFSLQMIIVPPDIGGTGVGNYTSSIFSRILYSRDQLPQAYQRLRKLASYYARSILDQRLDALVEQSGLAKAAEFLEQARYSWLPNNAQKFEEIEQDALHFTISPDPRLAQKISSNMLHYEPEIVQRDSINGVLQSISVLSFHNRIGLSATRIFERHSRGYSFQPASHLFMAEQQAARAEAELRNLIEDFEILHPEFVCLLEIGCFFNSTSQAKYITLADVFLRGWLYGLVQFDARINQWVVPEVGHFDSVIIPTRSPSLLDGLRDFALRMPCSSSFHESHPLSQSNAMNYLEAFHNALEASAESERKVILDQLRTMEHGEVQRLMRESDPVLRSLGQYLRFLIEEERFGIL